MPELPASVRLSLWATVALAQQSCSLEEAVERATPDIAEIDARSAQLSVAGARGSGHETYR